VRARLGDERLLRFGLSGYVSRLEFAEETTLIRVVAALVSPRPSLGAIELAGKQERSQFSVRLRGIRAYVPAE
jgi:hypothetical protein